MTKRGFEDVYVCSQCGDTLIGDELVTIGRDDCDEGYVKYTLPSVALQSIRLGRDRARLLRRLDDNKNLYQIQVQVVTKHESSIYVVADSLEEALEYTKNKDDWQEDERLFGGVIQEEHQYQILGGELAEPLTQKQGDFQFHDCVYGLDGGSFPVGHLKGRFW